MKFDRTASWLLLPGVVLLLALLVLPLLNTVLVSFKLFTPGQIGAAANAPVYLQELPAAF